MTAEVAVLNTTAVALAADSAISIGPSADKIYTSVDKLFLLVEDVPVGIMINGSAGFLGTPWETIIKAYRKERQRQTFPYLTDYRDDFLRFVSSHGKLFPANAQYQFAKMLIHGYLEHILTLIERAVDEKVNRDEKVEESDIPKIVHDVIVQQYNYVSKKKKLRGFDNDFVREIRKNMVRRIKEAKDKVFAELPLDLRTTRLVTRLVFEVLTRDHMAPLQTGLVFAGFGEEEFMPRLYAVNVEIMINGRIRIADDEKRSCEISNEMQASISPFAQSEMVYSFVRGIHPQMTRYMAGTVVGVFERLVEQIVSATQEHDSRLSASLADSLSDAVPLLVKELGSSWEHHANQHSRPIVANVAALPKDELGAMAESLVNLTKFRRRISQDRETVSGPIDVAVISKGDGFVWVKRKHYFKPDLNPRKMSKYIRSD